MAFGFKKNSNKCKTRFFWKCSSKRGGNTNPVDLFINSSWTLKTPSGLSWSKERFHTCRVGDRAQCALRMPWSASLWITAELDVKEYHAALMILCWISRDNKWKVILAIHQHRSVSKRPHYHLENELNGKAGTNSTLLLWNIPREPRDTLPAKFTFQALGFPLIKGPDGHRGATRVRMEITV